MKGKYTTLVILMLAAQLTYAQQDGVKAIEKLCGCYDVTFTYAETFATDTNYKYHDRKTSHALELITPIERTDKKLVLQHMLIVNEHYIIKHWREDWTYEHKELLSYTGNNTWVKEKLPAEKVSGQWTQTVWQVDDMPRYQGYSAWITNNGQTYWENTAYAPLPRREYTTRSDYNLMKRTNRITPTEYGWLHEQDNDKIIRSAAGDSLLVQEKGMNIYRKTDESKCAVALQNWEESKTFWVVVRKQWQHYIDKQNVLVVKNKVDDEMLFQHLYVVEADWKKEKWSDKQLAKKIKDLFDQFISEGVAVVK